MSLFLGPIFPLKSVCVFVVYVLKFIINEKLTILIPWFWSYTFIVFYTYNSNSILLLSAAYWQWVTRGVALNCGKRQKSNACQSFSSSHYYTGISNTWPRSTWRRTTFVTGCVLLHPTRKPMTSDTSRSTRRRRRKRMMIKMGIVATSSPSWTLLKYRAKFCILQALFCSYVENMWTVDTVTWIWSMWNIKLWKYVARKSILVRR